MKTLKLIKAAKNVNVNLKAAQRELNNGNIKVKPFLVVASQDLNFLKEALDAGETGKDGRLESWLKEKGMVLVNLAAQMIAAHIKAGIPPEGEEDGENKKGTLAFAL